MRLKQRKVNAMFMKWKSNTSGRRDFKCLAYCKHCSAVAVHCDLKSNPMRLALPSSTPGGIFLLFPWFCLFFSPLSFLFSGLFGLVVGDFSDPFFPLQFLMYLPKVQSFPPPADVMCHLLHCKPTFSSSASWNGNCPTIFL